MPNIDNFPGLFTVEIDGQPIIKPIDNGDNKFFARIGNTEPAVFSLRGGRLESAEYVLGRSQIEDRSLLPKSVFWFKKGFSSELAQVTFLNDDEGELKILFGGGVPSHNYEYLTALIIPSIGTPAKVTIKPFQF